MNKKYSFLLILLLSLTSFSLMAQDKPERYVPSKLYARGEYEIHLFNNYFTWGEQRSGKQFRYNFFTSDLQFLYGLTSKLNVGIDLKLRSVTQSLSSSTNLLEALKWSNTGYYAGADGTGYRRSGLSAVGLRWKLAPFDNIPNFSLQQTLFVPTRSDLEGNSETGFLDWSGYSFHTQLYYDHNITQKISLFVEGDIIIENIGKAMFGKANGYFQWSTPVSIILSYFPNSRHTLYGLVNAAPQWGANVIHQGRETLRIYNPYNQYGLGYKYAFSSRILTELIWTKFFNNSATAQIYTYNIGIRYFVNK